MKILLSSVKDQRQEFAFSAPVRLENLEAAGRAEAGSAELRISVVPAGERWILSAEVAAEFPFRCDRCGRPYRGRLTGAFERVVLSSTSGGLEAEASEEVLLLGAGSRELDLRPQVMEALWLDLPIQLSCEAAGGEACPGPQDESGAAAADAAMDPRWGPLAELKQQLERRGESPASGEDDNDEQE